MIRKPVEWLGRIDPDDDRESRQMVFRVTGSWVAIDDDQLILPIEVLEKTDVTIDESYSGLLKQYGGEGLLNDMLMSEQDPEEGSEWVLDRYQNYLDISPRD